MPKDYSNYYDILTIFLPMLSRFIRVINDDNLSIVYKQTKGKLYNRSKVKTMKQTYVPHVVTFLKPDPKMLIIPLWIKLIYSIYYIILNYQ